MPTSVTTPASPQIWAKRLESNERSRVILREQLITSLKPWLRDQMKEFGTINYWQLPGLADHFSSGQISHDVLLSVAEALVRDSEWIDDTNAEQGDHWAPNPDFDPGQAS